MRSIRDIISSLNKSFDLPKGSEVNGIAELVFRDDTTLPEVDGKYVGIDDTYSVRIYHRLLGMQTKIAPRSNFGDSAGDISNTYSLAMVVFLQKERAKMYPDELLTRIQASMPETIKMEPYRRINIVFSGAALDSQSNWVQEYRTGTDYRLKSGQYLFKINYSIETIFSKGCFPGCP
jgi:hypothetical protein